MAPTITFLPGAVEPVKASLSTPALHSAAPVGPAPVTTWITSGIDFPKRA